MSNAFPFYTEGTHDTGVITNATANAARSTATSTLEGRQVLDVQDKIFLLEPTQTPLTTLLSFKGKTWDGQGWKGSSMSKKSCFDTTFGWVEDFYGGRYAKVSGTCTNAVDQTPTVTGAGTQSAYIFTTGDVVKNIRTGECAVIGTIPTATTIQLHVRGFGSSPASAWADGDELLIVGNVNEENGVARNVNTTRASKQTNYVQIFKTTIALSNSEKASKLYGGPDLDYQRVKKGTEHGLDIERAFWLGEKTSDTGGTQGKPRRATGGVLEFIEAGNSYVQNQGGILTAPDMETFVREGFTYGSNTKMLFAGGIVLQAINEMARGQLRTVMSDKTYGVSITQWDSTFGTVNIVRNPLFVGTLNGYGFLLDMDCFAYRFLEGRDTKLNMNVQPNDMDGQIDEYLSEVGLERKQASRCALLKGVTA